MLANNDISGVEESMDENKFIASAVIDVTFIPATNSSAIFDTPIVLQFELRSSQLESASKYDKISSLCVYWNTSSSDNTSLGIWATNGCELTDQNDTHVICSCYHLTHFAVLMIREPGAIGATHVRVLTILSNIGCSLSVFGSVATVLAFIFLKMNTDRVLIHSNLASSIAMSQILFLAQGSLQPMTIGCKVMAGIMYYFFTASFVWMMVEGLQLYTQVVLVFNQENSKMRYYMIGGWGIPLIMTAVVIGSTLESIGRRPDVCWLDYSDNSIYLFVIPTLCVVIANMAILTRVTVVIVNLKNHDQLKRDDAKYQKLKYALKASLTISPLMGSTWMFGVLTLADSSNLAFLYIFVLCNSIQGLLIFILHCLNSQEVRDVFKRRMELYRIGRSVRKFRIQPTNSSMNDSTTNEGKFIRSTVNTLSSMVSKDQKTT
nr:adhesion G-protein coupled receptor D1-like [Lytechinus pictus]